MPSPEMLVRTGHYTEGVVVDAKDSLFFSMTSIGTISHLRPGEREPSVWAHVPAANGHQVDADGSHVVMSSVGAIVRLDPSGRASGVVATSIGGRWLTYPNDVALDRKRGGFYITDSGYKETPKTMPSDPQGRLYHIDAAGTAREVADGIGYANGIALSPDGSLLYVGESVTGRIWTYPVLADGALGARTPFAVLPVSAQTHTVPDGITVGPQDRIYVAHWGAREVLVYDVDGTLAERLDAGNRTTSHVAFSNDGGTMYVSGGIDDEHGAGAIFAMTL